jgi:hypothetical protein
VPVLKKGFFVFKEMLINRWTRLRERMESLAKTKNQYRFEAALFSYLIPCYITAFVESNKGEANGVIFFGRVLQLLLTKSSSMLDSNQPQEPVSVRDTADLIAQLWLVQNKVILGDLGPK